MHLGLGPYFKFLLAPGKVPQQLKTSPAWSCLTLLYKEHCICIERRPVPLDSPLVALLSSVQPCSQCAELPEPEMQLWSQSPRTPAAQETQPDATQQEGTTRPPLIRCTDHLRHVNTALSSCLSASCIIHASLKWFLCVF